PITAGASQRFILRLAELISPSDALKGTFRRLIAKKNHAPVPTNSNFGGRQGGRWMVITAPAGLAIMVVEPASHPKGQVIPGCSTARFITRGANFCTSTRTTRARVSQPMNGPKFFAGIGGINSHPQIIPAGAAGSIRRTRVPLACARYV